MVGRGAGGSAQRPLTRRWNVVPPLELQTPPDRFYGGRPRASGVSDLTLSSALHRPHHGEYCFLLLLCTSTHLSLSLPVSLSPAGRVMNACSATTWETTTTVSSPSLTCQYKYSPSRRWWVQSDCLSRRWEVKDRMFLTTPVHLFSHHPQSSHSFTFIKVCFYTLIMMIIFDDDSRLNLYKVY